jgi:hypothetical protein
MASEAAGMVVLDDLNAARDPMLRRAPPEFWERLARGLRHSEPLGSFQEADEFFQRTREHLVVAAQLHLCFERARDVVKSDFQFAFSSKQQECRA